VSSLRVGINLLWLLPGEGAGAEVYSMRVLRALLDEPAPELDLTVFANRRLAHAHPEELGSVPVATAPVDGGSRTARVAAESTWLPREVRRRRLDLVHHMADVVPWLRGRPSVLTIHDLRALHRPDILGTPHAAYLRARLRPSVRASSVVITPTETVRSSVVDELGADPDRVRVVSAPLFALADDPPHPGIAGPFFVYPSTTEPHKNHATLIRAFAGVAGTGPGPSLVLTGAPGRSDRDVAAEIERRRMGDAVLRLGRVPRERLDGLIARAVAVVYPSEYEGFGLPLAEAMAAGCPVIASDLPVIREVVGDAGVLVDPSDTAAWADAMRRLLDDDALRDRLASAGRERAGRFTPAETSRRLSDAYRFAAGRSSPTA
jgi:glycosyltransferase involved in cell wall biosynthesis